MMYGEILKMGKMTDGRVRVHASIDVDGVEEYATMEFDEAEIPFTKFHKRKEYAFSGVTHVGAVWRFLSFSDPEAEPAVEEDGR